MTTKSDKLKRVGKKKYSNKKRILVTGGAGYIGSQVCKALFKAGFVPITYDNLSRGNKWAVKWGPLIKGDLLNLEHITWVLEEYKPSAVLHFAAFAYVGESVENPQLYFKNNVMGTLNLLESMLKNSINIFVFSSSCAIYGDPVQIPIDENHPKNPVNPYGLSKLMVENILQSYDRAFSLRSFSLRYFNAAGADKEKEIGEWHDPETHLIPNVLSTAMGKRDKVDIFGDDYDTKDGTCIRDYIHVTDLANAHILALEILLKGHKTDFVNLGTGCGYSVKQVVDICEKVSNKKINVNIIDRREGDPAVLVASHKKASEVLAWQPVRDLETQVRDAWNWSNEKYK